MAMTKKERAEFDAALTAARVLGALRWTTPVERDVPPPQWGAPNSTGYIFNAYTSSVDVACSGHVSHGVGSATQLRSQGALHLFSTKLLALKALRCAVESQAARTLAAIDTRIAIEEGHSKWQADNEVQS